MLRAERRIRTTVPPRGWRWYNPRKLTAYHRAGRSEDALPRPGVSLHRCASGGRLISGFCSICGGCGGMGFASDIMHFPSNSAPSSITSFAVRISPCTTAFDSKTSFSCARTVPFVFPPIVTFLADMLPSTSPVLPTAILCAAVTSPTILPSMRMLPGVRSLPSMIVPEATRFRSVPVSVFTVFISFTVLRSRIYSDFQHCRLSRPRSGGADLNSIYLYFPKMLSHRRVSRPYRQTSEATGYVCTPSYTLRCERSSCKIRHRTSSLRREPYHRQRRGRLSLREPQYRFHSEIAPDRNLWFDSRRRA